MKLGERGQVTIPKEIRDKFGLGPQSEVEFQIVDGKILLKKVSNRLDIGRWVGHCKQSFLELGYNSVDEYVEEVRGR